MSRCVYEFYMKDGGIVFDILKGVDFIYIPMDEQRCRFSFWDEFSDHAEEKFVEAYLHYQLIGRHS